MNAIALYDRPSAQFDAKLAASCALLQDTLRAHPGAWTQANSLGAEDVVVTQLLHMTGLLTTARTTVFVLDTLRLHTKTLALVPQLEARYCISLRVFQPQAEQVIALVRRIGERGMFESKPQRLDCCNVRKMAPLARALAGQVGWITGLRREQSSSRADLAALEREPAPQGQRLKLNPIIDWTQGDVWHFIAQHQLPYNALHDAFYPSIGCAPCTRAISLGEDQRAGRWWWESENATSPAKECGLHVRPLQPTTHNTSDQAPHHRSNTSPTNEPAA